MTPQDRELFQGLTLRQAQLEEALAQLKADIKELELRAESQPIEHAKVAELPAPIPVVSAPVETIVPPPFPNLVGIEEKRELIMYDAVVTREPILPVRTTVEPIIPETAPTLQEMITRQEAENLLPAIPSIPLPEIPATREAEETGNKHVSQEIQFGRWLARIGVVFALITLISFSTLAYQHLHHLMGPWSRLTILALISVGLVAAGLRIERKNSKLTVYGRTMAGGGLACLYYTLYGATYVTPLQVIHSQLLGGILLLGWSAYVLYLAEKKKSELLSVFAIALAYFSSAITPVGDFTMAANLILSLTAVIFLVRNAWTGLSYLCLIGTYFGLLRQFVVYDSSYSFCFELSHTISFWPVATYLIGAWVIYTAGIFLARTENFTAGRRMAFLCLNNGALIGLLITASYLSGFGHIGVILCLVGGAFIATSYLSRYMREDAGEVTGAYLMQGLALGTGGVVIAYTGVTRGLLITVESVFLVAAGAYSRNLILRIGGGACALLGAGFLANEIIVGNQHPWVLTFGGAFAMLTNAWLARREFWTEPREVASQRWATASAMYILFAIGLLSTGFLANADSSCIAPGLALAALVLTASIYVLPLFELPLLAQALLVLAQIISGAPTFSESPAAQGMSLGSYAQPLWSELTVGLVTMLLVVWWPRQKAVRIGAWLQPMLVVYALAMVAISAGALYPHVDAQGWMISASLLSMAFILYGIYARTWQFAAAGQILLAISIEAFITLNTPIFPWAWWAAAIPIAVTYFTAWLVQDWLKKTEDLQTLGQAREILRFAIRAYQGLTVALIARLVFGLVPTDQIPLYFYVLGAGLMVWNLKWPSSMGLRCAMAFDVLGTFEYLSQIHDTPTYGSTWFNAIGLVFLLAQPGLLRRWGTTLISKLEITSLTFLANLSISLYVYWTLHPRLDEQGWMIAASILSLVYLAFGAWTRMWQFMISGQVYLGLAICTFLFPAKVDGFPWTWWAAAFPPAVVFLIGWATRHLLPRFLKLSEEAWEQLRIVAAIYQVIALGLTVRWVFGVVPADETTLTFFLLATGLLIWNVRWPNRFGLRAGLLVNFAGISSYLFYDENFSWINAVALFLFLTQPAILRRWGRELLTEAESWALILLSAGMAWLFINQSIDSTISHNLTMGWAIFALTLTLLGFAANERRQRWCGLIILGASILRGGIYDFWLLSDLYKVLTFFALTVICLGLSFLYYKFADRLKEWL